MPPDPDKRKLRELKRAIKKRGNKARRQQLKSDLRDDPEGAADVEESFRGNSSAGLNGLDRDSTRQRE